MIWSDAHDMYLCREVLMVEPYRYKPRSKENVNAWLLVAEDLNTNERVQFTVTPKSVKEHLQLLLTKHKAKMRRQEKESGSNSEETELDQSLVLIAEKMQAANETNQKLTDDAQAAVQQDRRNALEMRATAMERLAETQKRKAGEGELSSKKGKKRNTGTETIAYLREKSEKEMELRKQELEFKKQEAERQQQLLESLQTQNHTFQQQVMQQQQQQNQMLLDLIHRLADRK